MLPKIMTSEPNLNNYLRIREAAAILGVHPDTLRRWEKLNKLVAFRHPVNRYRLYHQEELEQLLHKVQNP